MNCSPLLDTQLFSPGTKVGRIKKRTFEMLNDWQCSHIENQFWCTKWTWVIPERPKPLSARTETYIRFSSIMLMHLSEDNHTESISKKEDWLSPKVHYWWAGEQSDPQTPIVYVCFQHIEAQSVMGCFHLQFCHVSLFILHQLLRPSLSTN